MTGAVDDDRPFASEALQYRRHHHELAAVVDAEELMVELHRIDERADEIEDRRHPQILLELNNLSELRMNVRCKEDGDLFYQEHHVCIIRAEIECNTQCREYIRTASPARHATVLVFHECLI